MVYTQGHGFVAGGSFGYELFTLTASMTLTDWQRRDHLRRLATPACLGRINISLMPFSSFRIGVAKTFRWTT